MINLVFGFGGRMMIHLLRDGHDSRGVANRFVELAQGQGKLITIMQLVKFVYLAHGWHLGFHDKPLIRDRVEAWKFGPVVPAVYRAFRPQGVEIVTTAKKFGYSSAAPFEAKVDDEQKSLIDGIFKAYSKLPYYALSALTHEPGTPWDKVKDNGYYAKIPDEVIRDYYRQKIDERNAQEGGA